MNPKKELLRGLWVPATSLFSPVDPTPDPAVEKAMTGEGVQWI